MKLGQEQKKKFFFFFCFRSNLRVITRLETLATQASGAALSHPVKQNVQKTPARLAICSVCFFNQIVSDENVTKLPKDVSAKRKGVDL